jgi:hypothetical protein
MSTTLCGHFEAAAIKVGEEEWQVLFFPADQPLEPVQVACNLAEQEAKDLANSLGYKVRGWWNGRD